MFSPPQTSATLLIADGLERFPPFRDSYAEDLFLYHDATIADRGLSALSCGFHDLRSVAFTLAEAERKRSRAAMSFVLNDLRPERIARALMVLHALNQSSLDRNTLDRFIGQLWFSELLEADALAFWITQMRDCIDFDWLSSTSKVRVLNDHTLKGIRVCWEQWLDRSEGPPLSTERAAKARDGLMRSPLSDYPSLADDEEFDAGSDWDATTVGEVETRRAASAVFMDSEEVVGRSKLAADPQQRFDIIDTSTLIDSCGLLNLVLHASFILKYNHPTAGDKSILRAASNKHVAPASTIDQFVIESTNVLPEWFPPFAPAAHESSRTMPYRRLTFCKAATPTLTVSLRNAVGFVDVIRHIIERQNRAPASSKYSHTGTFPTPSFIFKLLGYGFAARKFVFGAADPCTKLPWSDFGLGEPWLSQLELGAARENLSERSLYARIYGFSSGPRDDLPRAHLVQATFTLLHPESLPPASAIHVLVESGGTTAQYHSLTTAFDRANGVVHVGWYMAPYDECVPGTWVSLHAVPALLPRDAFPFTKPVLISDRVRLRSLVNVKNDTEKFVTVTHVQVTDLQAGLRGVMASAAAAAMAQPRDPAWYLPVLHATETFDEIRVYYEPHFRGQKLKLEIVPEAELAQYGGAIAVRVNGKVQTATLWGPGRVTEIRSFPHMIIVFVERIPLAVVPKLGVPPLVPRFALPSAGANTALVSSRFFDAAAFQRFRELSLAAEWDANSSNASNRPRSDTGAALMQFFEQVYAAAQIGGYDTSITVLANAKGLDDRLGMIVIDGTLVASPQGKCFGVTPLVTASFHQFTPLRAGFTKRSSAKTGGKDNRPPLSEDVIQIKWPHDDVSALREYLDFCETALVKTDETDALMAPTLFVDGQLRRGLLVPPYLIDSVGGDATEE
ncbi:hypothetical protein H9P43_009089 [Blastocladiella emersonii ATCC 22665]|nr:hypothetical protein H9P43_009089 [Blastocladiella emersonii ATCC 22665]